MTNRKADFKENTLISPADSTVFSQSKIETPNDLLIVKNVPYPLNEFLFGKNPHVPLNLRSDKDYYQITLYLSPGDCHRYFSPGRITVEKRFHNLGWFHPVKPDYVNAYPKTFLTNERVTLKAKYGENALFITYVSALNVGDIILNFDEDLKTNAVVKAKSLEQYFDGGLSKDYVESEVDRNAVTGQIRGEIKELSKSIASLGGGALEAEKEKLARKLENLKEKSDSRFQTGKGFFFGEMEEMGMFKFGSTIALIFEVDKGNSVDFKFNPGEKVKIGERLFDLK